MNTYYIAWWNLENLFDVSGSSARPEKLKKTLSTELKGWNQTILNKKIKQLAGIIRQMNQGQGPDVLGVCEVENKPVVDLLVNSLKATGHDYAAAHHDTSDERGIDVAFIYDSKKFKVENEFFYTVLKRTATRDLYQVNLRTKTPEKKILILVGNHWPARTAGVHESEPYRIIAAETLSYWNQRILEIYGSNVAAVSLGDFNDEPFNRSIVDYALGSNSRTKVVKAQGPRLLNLMWPFLGQGLGTHYYDNFPNVLDQFMVTKGLLTGAGGLKIKESAPGKYEVKIEMFKEMISPGDYPAPIKFGRPSAALNENGFSDHYPISMVLEES